MGKRIIVVDDDPILVRLCRLILEREGHQVLGVFSGAECLDSLRRDPVDLILLDILLDDMDGWKLLEEIQADHRLGSIPVVVVTGLSRRQVANQAAERPLAGYITKPFPVAKFLDQVRYALDSRAN